MTIFNMGKASISVNLSDNLPNIQKGRTAADFDVTAKVFNSLPQLGVAFPPILLECLADEEKGFSTFFPTRRRWGVNNFINTTNTATDNVGIYWTPTIKTSGIVTDRVKAFDTYTLRPPSDYGLAEYKGPRWRDFPDNGVAQPDDEKWFSEWVKAMRDAVKNTENTTTTTTTTPIPTVPKLYYINQSYVKDGLWWGIESNGFLKENMPIWITIDRTASPPTSNHETFLIISLGIDDEDNAFDIYIGTDKRPIIVDYYKGRKATMPNTSGASGGPPYMIREINNDLAKVWASEGHIEIGLMTVAGKLAIWVNKVGELYTRIKFASSSKTGAQDSGEVREAKIGAGRMRIYGSQCQMKINVSQMVFSPIGICALPIPVLNPADYSGQQQPIWSGVDTTGKSNGSSVAKLPYDPSTKTVLYGVDCGSFSMDDATDSPSGFGFHKAGYISVDKASAWGFVKASQQDYYVLSMETDGSWGCPYYFRLKGHFETAPKPNSGAGLDVSPDVLSATEEFSADDYFAIAGTATVTLYNKDGKYDNLKLEQKGIQISWGWNGVNNPSFTGIVTNVTSSETPGKEEITLHCSDYMFILKNSFMFNSPYYDGMIMYWAAVDIVKRAGVITVINDWDNTDEYYLPSGYAFTAPAVHFHDTDVLYDNVKSIVQRAEATFYFDESGVLHIMKLPGGLFSVKGAISATFVRTPGQLNTILDTKNVEYDYTDTSNRITIFSLDRDSRDGIIYTKSATGNNDHLLYTRLLYIEEAALGRQRVVQAYVDELAQRVFYPIRKVSFQTVGQSQNIRPLSFIQADGLEYRVMSASKKFDAANNDYTMEFNCEWLGGK